MEHVVTQALAGTAHMPPGDVEEPWGAVAAPPERAVWLRAGAWATYERAGRKARRDLAAPVPAPAEHQAPCPPNVSALLAQLAAGPFPRVFREALAAVAARQWLLPPALLPLALDQAAPDLREVLRPLLGERGAWLASFRDDWAWARCQPGNLAPAEAARRWAEGSPEEREAALVHVRATDPALALAWLAEGLQQERAATRLALLEAIATSWTAADEPFLEGLLADRSAAVRAHAAHHLAGFPASALAGRIRERLAALRGPDGRYQLPEACPKDWVRDGIQADDPPHGMGPRSWWLTQLVALADPADVGPVIGQPHADALVPGLARAIARLADGARAQALYAALEGDDSPPATEARHTLRPLMPASWHVQGFLDALVGDALNTMSTAMPGALDAAASNAWLAIFAAKLAGFDPEKKDTYAAPWNQAREEIALALAPASLRPIAAALDELEARHAVVIARLGNAWTRFRQTIDLRRRIHEEIAP
jgi:hypothetical protein